MPSRCRSASSTALYWGSAQLLQATAEVTNTDSLSTRSRRRYPSESAARSWPASVRVDATITPARSARHPRRPTNGSCASPPCAALQASRPTAGHFGVPGHFGLAPANRQATTHPVGRDNAVVVHALMQPGPGPRARSRSVLLIRTPGRYSSENLSSAARRPDGHLPVQVASAFTATVSAAALNSSCRCCRGTAAPLRAQCCASRR